MGFFARLKRVVTSNINQYLNKAEDPEKMLNQLLVEMNEQFISTKKTVASAIADETLLKRRASENQKKAEVWEKRASLALNEALVQPHRKEYYEELARKALMQQRDCRETASKYNEQAKLQKESVEQLKSSLQDLQMRIEEARRKKNLLIARARRAETQRKIQGHTADLQDNSAFQAFDKMEEKVEQIEAETKAIINIDSNNEKTLEKEFILLENPLKKPMIEHDNSELHNNNELYNPEIDSMMEDLKNRLKEN